MIMLPKSKKYAKSENYASQDKGRGICMDPDKKEAFWKDFLWKFCFDFCRESGYNLESRVAKA